ncbi:hypothetical protein DWB58_21020 [candidate division KSB1 bacterium]|nr:hypothetical protein [candidate division KSB1 bacterium]
MSISRGVAAQAKSHRFQRIAGDDVVFENQSRRKQAVTLGVGNIQNVVKVFLGEIDLNDGDGIAIKNFCAFFTVVALRICGGEAEDQKDGINRWAAFRHSKFLPFHIHSPKQTCTNLLQFA